MGFGQAAEVVAHELAGVEQVAFGGEFPSEVEIGGGVERDEAAQGRIGLVEGDGLGDLAAGGTAEQDETVGVDAEGGGVFLEVEKGGADIVARGGPRVGGGETIIDGGDGDAAGGELLVELGKLVAAAGGPAAAVNDDQARGRLSVGGGAGGAKEVELERG